MKTKIKTKIQPKLGPKEKLEQALNIAAKELNVSLSPTIQPEVIPPTPTNKKLDTKEDYDFVRKNLKSLIERGNVALEQLSDLIEEGGSPREFEVFSQLVKALTETTKELILIQKEMRDIETKDKDLGENTNPLNSDKMLSLNTVDLLKIIKELPEGSK